MRSAVAFQLPYGGWRGADSWIGYHSSIARSVIDTYVALPNTLETYAKKDRLARCITAALNRLLVGQQEGAGASRSDGATRSGTTSSRVTLRS